MLAERLILWRFIANLLPKVEFFGLMDCPIGSHLLVCLKYFD